MKVFFSMSFRGNLSVGRQIYSSLEKLGHTHTSNAYAMDIPEKFYQWSNAERAAHYEEVFAAMHQADAVVLESSIHSLTIGQMIQDCLDNDISLLILVQEKSNLAFLDGLQEEKHRLLILEYEPNMVMETLSDGLEYLSHHQEARFTMILPNHMIRFLDDTNKKTGLSRSEFIRQLIREKMERV